MLQYEHTQSRRKVGRIRLPASVDTTDEVRDSGVVLRGNCLDLRPERVFQANACLVAIDHDRSLDDR